MPNIRNSQNFLYDQELVEKLVNAKIDKNDYVIEIGPGKGTITDVLARHASKVTAIEFDETLYQLLLEKHHSENVEYIYGDFLKYKLPPKGKYKVFSNIPFQITADIIHKLTESSNLPTDIYLIVQKEAAKKYCGMPLQKYEGLQAAIVKNLYDLEILYNFKRTDFKPTPNVDIVLLHLKKNPIFMQPREDEEYKDLVSYFYMCNKGETAKERLSILFSNEQIKRLAKDNKIDLQDSYSRITANQWRKIYLYSKIGLSEEKKKVVFNSYKRLKKIQSGLKKQNRTTMRNTRKPMRKVTKDRIK